MTRHIPNLLTLGNLVTGCIGIVCAFERPEIAPIWFVAIACTFDFLDGFAARLLKVSSPMGKELDSLADVVSFGVYPSVIVFKALQQSHANDWMWAAFALAAFAALRLARFNTDDRQTEAFIGLPTPAMAMFIAPLPAVVGTAIEEPYRMWTLLAAVSLMSAVMVAPLPLTALKFKTFSWSGNQVRYGILAGSAALLLWLGSAGLPAVILLYLSSTFFASKH